MSQAHVDKITQLVSGSFESNEFKIEKNESGGTDIYISASSIEGYKPKRFMLAFDSQAHMFIDDYVWEFDDNFDKAIEVMTEYVHGLRDGKLVEKPKKLLWILKDTVLVVGK